MRAHVFLSILLIGLLSIPTLSRSAQKSLPRYDRQSVPPEVTGNPDGPAMSQSLAPAMLDTTVLVLYRFQYGDPGTCAAQGWTTVDMTAQTGTWFHVDDYAGLTGFSAIEGDKSLWLGARPSGASPLCTYQSLPGYGNNWNQAWCTKTCIPVSGDLAVAFDAIIETEAGWDALTLEYTTDCSGASGWTELDGGIGVWDGAIPLTSYGGAYPAGNSVKVRLHFQSDLAWSDEDGLLDTDGAVHIDNLVVEGLALENFEDEAVNATSSNDWEACTPPGYGQHMSLFVGSTVLQHAFPSDVHLSCLWAAISNSSENYACGGFMAQVAVPKGNLRGQYLHNEIWSPNIPLVGEGSKVNLQFAVYRDNPLDNLVFYLWHVRTIGAGGCPGPWRDLNFVYYGPGGWTRHVQPVGGLLDLVNGVYMNVALGAIDVCRLWCGTYGTGACHSHAPLFDDVKVYRVQNSPQWSIRDIDQFQDTFASDGTVTGTARADMARDILSDNNAAILPGDSAVVLVADPSNGLAVDPTFGGPAVYLYLAVWPLGQPNKSGGDLQASETRGGNTRFPVVGTWVDGAAVTWTCVRMDSTFANDKAIADTYCVDLNDNLFEPGDTVCFFYHTVSAIAVESYAYGSNLGLSGADRNDAAANASEFTVLPAGGWNNGGDILYVDGMDGRGSQPLFDDAFKSLGLLGKVDRYDVRGPSSMVHNGPASRVVDVASQLTPCYRKIIWDCGDLEAALGDGGPTIPRVKPDDYALLNAFLGNLASGGGAYLCGDNLPTSLGTSLGASAVGFRATYLTYLLTYPNAGPVYGTSPVGTPVAGGAFSESFVIYGGQPLINQFDVMTPQGSAKNEVTYGAGTIASNNGAVLSQATNNGQTDVGVLLGGFSFAYIRDNESDGIVDRAAFLYEAITWLGNVVSQPTSAASPRLNRLEQNYPNPFNPRTTIAFALKEPGHASIKIYNIAGELVRTLANEAFTAGDHTRVWDGRNDAGAPVASGVYFYKLVAKDFSQTRKMVVLK